MTLPTTNKKKTKNSFGATAPPFIDYLKEILRRYPDGGQILKELIQNADDAGASKAIFIHDERRYGTDRIWSPAMGKYQGPALYAFNDAGFTDEDWEGIQRAGRSIKHDDPSKVGRFGIGFNSVYHVTDLPCVFSSKHLAVFDPQKLMFDDEREGYRWSLDDDEDRKHLLEFTDQFKPFRDIINLVCDDACAWEKIINERYLTGTLFRFPLRHEASEISDNLYDSNKATQLFDSFIPDADISVLFLRSVSSISLLHIDINGSVTIRMNVSASSSSVPLQQTEENRRNCLQGKTIFKTVSCSSPHQEETSAKWLVTACRLKEGHVPEIDALACKLSFYPQVDVAFQCDEDRTCDSGRLSCFLPLPNNETNRTGLPVHINACFGLTDNRRYIKWQEEDQKNDESAEWNELLMKKVLPHVYLKIIQDGVQLSRKSALPVSAVYSLWPDLRETEHRPRWHEVAVDLFHRLFPDQELFSLAKNEKKWVAASNAVFPTDDTDTHVMSAVFCLLIKAEENLVTAPDHALLGMKKTFPNPDTLKWVTPSLVRSVLRRREIESITEDEKRSILEYVLSDGKYEDLKGLQLLPLSDGSFRSFTNQPKDTALIDSEQFPRVLLPFCKDRFLPHDLNRNTVEHLTRMASTNSKLYQLINLDANSVAALAKEHLPRDWKETNGHVKWNSAKDDHPPKTWLKEFWKFLNTHWTDLREFIGMPLIPLEPLRHVDGTVMLARLVMKPTLIFQNSRESTLSDHVQKVLKLVGGTVIKKDDCLKHYDIENYVLTPSPRNVMQVLLNLDIDRVVRGFASASIHEKEEFKTYISSLDSLSDAEKGLLSALPIFRSMSEQYVTFESKQAVILRSNPAIPKDLPVPDTIIQCANEADRRLLNLLKVELLDAAQLAIHLLECIDGTLFNKEDEQKIMTWILNHGQILFSQSEELFRRSKNLSFILTAQGERRRPSSVFDPTKKIFLDLFEEDFFPQQAYRSPKILQSLEQLGLQTKEEQISPANILHVASQIQKLHIHSRNRAFKKADVLVRILNRNDLLSKFSEGERRELLQLQWVPCENPNSVKGKNSLKRSFYKPTEIRASVYSAIVGHVMPLASDLNESICHKLDLYSPPPAEKVLENLCVLISLAPTMGSPDSDYEFKNKLHSTYIFMQENTKAFSQELSNKCIPWLWSQTEFVSPREVVLSYPSELDLSPYIKKVPDEFLQYDDLLRECGVKETLADEEIETILCDIKENIDDRTPPYGEPSELKVSTAILDWMRKNEKSLKDSTPVPVKAQNQNFTLQPLKDTVFCDISHEGLDDLTQDNEEFYVIHEEVLPVTARWLKIPFLSTRILKPQFIGVEEEYEGIEQCGQTEPITQRIKNILKEYDDERDIFKELIQNAEDARASTCGFMLDFRTHPCEGLIDDGMAQCNGPCLWAYNNELFSEEDWKNIVRVGSASKETKFEKIGKFGLGFNAVYHVTDIPSILSGKNLLILDPNVTHLEKHIKSRAIPGIKLDLFHERLFRRFPGQFNSYQGIFDCDLSNSNQKYYSGTLIKLPFRTADEACESEISSKVYDEEHINKFRQHFADDSVTPLLFLKHIKSLTLQTLNQEPIDTVLKISKEVLCPIKISNETHLQDIKETLKGLDPKCREIVDCLVANIVEIVCEDAERSSSQFWFLYSCFGTKDSLRMFQTGLHQCKFSLPIGGVAVPLQKESDNTWSASERCANSQAFCFLPLPIDTGLPVHINGSFAVTSNRKALWETGTKLEWNKALLQDAVATAYINTLLELKKLSQNGNLQNYDYSTFWPDIQKVNKGVQPLVSAFYSAVVQSSNGKSLELFSNGKSWCSFDKARFLDPSIQKNETVGKLAMDVFLKYTEPNYCPVPLPSWVRNNLIHCGFSEMVKERTFDWFDFYRVVFKNFNKMDSLCRDALILNAIDLNNHEVDKLLKSHACIPTRNAGPLQFTNKLVNPCGKVACLYEPEEGRFLGGTENDYFSPKRISRLSSLGMLSDVLTLEEAVERAKTISRVWRKNKKNAYKRLQCLFDSMERLSQVDSSHWETLKHISYLPALGTNQDNEETVILKKPSEVYEYRCYQLVNLTEFTVDRIKLGLKPDDPVLTKLGVMDNPPVGTVLKQLKEAHNRAKSLETSVLLDIAKNCYAYLSKYLLNDGDPTAITKHAQSIPFILIENHFVHVESVAMGGEFEEKPYLYVLPNIFSKFENLWSCIGMNRRFTAKQFLAVLEKISKVSKPVSERDLYVCIAIITKGLYGALLGTVKECLMPDERGVLTHSSKLKFNDSPWMPVQAGITFCHKLIPREVALSFGVITTKHHTLGKALMKTFSPFAKEFGQHEKLTVRIKNIMEAYPAKKDILKEFLQNADDAEATEIHFVWDKRKHGTQKTFGESWEMLQGPALCVYNNKKFSDEDLIGIQQLGEGGKHGTLGRTGKYGLGFNSVYHLTDCPSILSGDEYLCISDPNLKYVEVGTKESPGCMYSINDHFKKSFQDVYDTFLPEKFPLNSGTFFRLPLRTEEMADKSEISRNPVRDYEMMELFQALKADPEELILFLKYIAKIHFHEIDTDGREVSYFKIEKKVTKDTREQREGFHNDVCNSLKSGRVVPAQTIYKVHVESGKKQSHWIIAEQYGCFLQNQEEGEPHSRVPQAGVAACIATKPTERTEFSGRAFCSLPLPTTTGLPVHVNGNFEVDHSRRDLWKEDGDSVKTKWNQFLQLKIIAPLYADLLTYICANFKKGEPKMLGHLKSHLNFCFKFFPVVSKDVLKVWQDMISEVYRSINQRNLPVIPVLSFAGNPGDQSGPKYTFNWLSVSNPDPTDAPHFTGDSHDLIVPVLEHIGMNLVPNSWKIIAVQYSFRTAGVHVAEVSPSSVIGYLKKKRMNDPLQSADDLPLPINQTLISNAKTCSKLLKFCLKNDHLSASVAPNVDKKSQSIDLNGLPLLLTQDQMLRKFSSHSPKIISEFSNIFQENKSDFVDYQVNFTHELILEKGNYIKKLTIPVAAKFIKPVLQQQLQNSPFHRSNGLHAAGPEIKKWLNELWKYFDSEVKKDSQGEDSNLVFTEIKKHFSGSPILPVIYPDQKETCFLQQIGNLSSVVHDPKEYVSAILIKLGFMILDRSFFFGLPGLLNRYVQPELLKASDSSAVLKELDRISHSQFENLSGDESDSLQRFLQSGFICSKSTNDEKIFKSLPLFQTICGKRQRIDVHGNVFILKSKFQKIFPGLYRFDHSNCIFLKYNDLNKGLSTCMDIKIMDDLEYCVRFIITSVHNLNQTQLLDLIRLLVELKQRNTSKYDDYKFSIVSALRDKRFIQDINGSLQVASYFYDESVKLYKVMLPKERFVPKTFFEKFQDENQVKSLLSDLGLKHVVSEEEVITFAHQMESDAKGHIDLRVLKARSATLLSEALRLGSKEKSKLMEKITTVKFILPVKIEPKLCNYHRSLAQERDVVAIKGSLLEKQPDHQYLIWTSMPILPSMFFTQNCLKSLRKAGAVDEPPSEQVMQNLRNISRSQCRTEELIETRATVFKNSYGYLQSVNFNEALLADVPLILVENDRNLVKASQAVLTLTDANEFRPYLYPIQSKHAVYAEFFKKIGVEEKPTVTQFCTVLAEIHTETCDKETLHPNQLTTVQHVVQQLFCLIKDEGKSTPFQNTLYLPSTDGKLYESSTLFFNDTFFQAHRLEASLKTKLKLLVKLNECHLQEDPYEHQQLLQLLPERIRPKMLTQVISVNLVAAHVEHCDYGTSCEFSGWFQERLSSHAFQHGLICLIRDQSKGTISQGQAAEMCESIFGKIQIDCCKTLHTELLLNNQPLEGTETETQVYVKKQQNECVFYLKHSDNMSHKVVSEVNIYLTKEINALLKNILNSLSLPVLGHLLLCENMDDVEKALEQHGIRNTASGEKGLGSRPSPGTLIPEEWHDSLDMDLLNSFEKGEYVGFSKDGDEYVFAIVVECLDEHPGQTSRYPSRYRIQIEDDKIIDVSSLDLYQFKREKRSDPFGNACTDIDIVPTLTRPETSRSVPSQSEISWSAPSPKRPFPQTLEEAKTEIDQSLEQIWKMSDEDKSKAMRRLYLRWHPDKNPDNTELATEAFKYLQNRIEEQRQGKTKHNTSSQQSTSNWARDFRDFYESWNYQARSHRRGRERFFQNNFRQRYNFWSHFRDTPRPNREEAKRWYRQAQCDLLAAQSDTAYNASPEWCLFKVHQAVEKTLIATEFRRNGKHPGTASTIAGLAQKVSRYATYLYDVPQLVTQLRALGVDPKRTQYPDCHPRPHIPNGQFKTKDAEEAVKLATKLLNNLEKYISE